MIRTGILLTCYRGLASPLCIPAGAIKSPKSGHCSLVFAIPVRPELCPWAFMVIGVGILAQQFLESLLGIFPPLAKQQGVVELIPPK